MKLIFDNEDVEEQCTNLSAAKKLFGGDSKLAISLMARINALTQADTIKDIVLMPSFHFHSLENQGKRRLKGYFAIDVKSRKDPWRIILEPLDDDEKPFQPCYINEIAGKVRIVKILEVSKHYE